MKKYKATQMQSEPMQYNRQWNLDTLYDIVDTLAFSKHYWINTLGSVDHHHDEYKIVRL